MKNTFLNQFINRLYKKNTSGNSLIILVSIVLIILFISLQFRSSLLIIPSIRDAKIKQLLLDTQKNKNLDIQELAELKDSFGSVVHYNPEYLEPYSILQFKDISESKVLLFEYKGNGVYSKEYLVPANSLTDQIGEYSGTKIFQNDQSSIYLDQSTHTVYVRTTLSFKDMKKNNGMIDYQHTKQDLSDRSWVTETVFDVSPHFSTTNL